MIDRFMRACDRLFNEQKLVRRLLVLWAVCLITWVTLQVFADLKLVTAPVASALATVTALLTVVVGFYQWSRGREINPKESDQ